MNFSRNVWLIAFCMLLCFRIMHATTKPTKKPTNAPRKLSSKPSRVPTSKRPSRSPSSKPTSSPTKIPFAPPSRSPSSKKSIKRGAVLGSSDPNCATKINSLNPNWYYNWGMIPVSGVYSSIPFVPMVWGKNNFPTTNQFSSYPFILGFNEPDKSSQSNIAVADARTLWPKVVASGAKQIGNPSTAGNPTNANSWLSQFVVAPSPQLDFICMHWYSHPKSSSFLGEIDAIYKQYKKPIWVTEFAVADWTGTTGGYPLNQVMQFMNESIAGLENRSYVVRYTWKTRVSTDVHMGTSALFGADNLTLSALGKMYASF